MDMALLAVLVGLGVGVVVGALGAGGGILALPVLVHLLGQDPYSATASSLIIVGITAIASIGHHARKRNVAWRAGIIFAGVAVAGAVVGSRTSALVPEAILMTLFGGLLAVVAAVMVRRALVTRAEERAEAGADPSEPLSTHDDPVLDSPGPDTVVSAEGTTTHHGAEAGVGEGGDEELGQEGPGGAEAGAGHRGAGSAGLRPLPLILAATTTGLLTGFFGVGGGFIVVPMLVIALGLAMRRASGTSLLVMIVTTLVSLLARIGTDVEIDWVVTLLFAAGSSIGGIIGGPLSAKARASTLTTVFAALLAGVALVTLGQRLLA